MSNQTKQKFYNLFWNNSGCRELFTRHKEELLVKEEGEIGSVKKHFYHKRLVLSNSLKRPDAIKRIEHRLENRTIDLKASLQQKSDKNLPEIQIAAYLKQKWGKPLDAFSKKLTGNRFTQVRFMTELLGALASEKRLVHFLHKYLIVPSRLHTITEIVDWVDQSVEKEAEKWLRSEHFADVFLAVDEIARHYHNYNYGSLIESHDFYKDVLYDKDNFKDRMAMFDSLYECNVLQGGVYKAFYECTSCEIDVFSGSITLKVTPSKARLKCPNCGKEVFYLVPYKIEESIFDDIISKDGLLAEAIAYLLAEHKIPHTRNAFAGSDRELDVAISDAKGQFIDNLEVKMFKVERADDVILSNLSEGLRKLIKTVDILQSNALAGKHTQFHYATNVEQDSLIRELKHRFRNELRERPIQVHTPDTIFQTIEALAEKK